MIRFFFVFTGDYQKTIFCEVKLSEEKYQAFVYAVKNHYWYQMYIDDLPIWGLYAIILKLFISCAQNSRLRDGHFLVIFKDMFG